MTAHSWSSRWRRARWLAAGHLRWFGLASALAIATLANGFAVRFDRRWDFTTDRRYTPSASLQHILRDLRQDATVVVLLGRSDPLAPTVEQLLSSYRQLTRHLLVDWVDPDRDPARFLARQAELGLGAGHTEDGKVTSNAVLVVTARGRHYYVEADELISLDPDSNDGTSHFEHALAVALRTLFELSTPTVCFTEGHRELTVADRSPQGLSRLKERLERDAMHTKVLDLGHNAEHAFADCRLIVVAAPDVPLTPDALRQLTSAATRSSLLLLGGVVPNATGALQSVGLEPLAKLGGIALEKDVVIERDDAFRLPDRFGETFLATPREHPTTRALLRGNGASPLRVVVSLARSLRREPGTLALPLLESSPQSVSLAEISQQSLDRLAPSTDTAGSRIVAMAGPLGGSAERCRIAVAPASIVQNRAFESPELVVTQAFAMSLVSWLLATDESSVEFAPRAARLVGLELSAEEFGDIARYVVLVVPGCVLLAGVAILLLRRRQRPVPSEGSK